MTALYEAIVIDANIAITAIIMRSSTIVKPFGLKGFNLLPTIKNSLVYTKTMKHKGHTVKGLWLLFAIMTQAHARMVRPGSSAG